LAKIQEFDLEVKPTKLVKDWGLAKLMAESNLKALGMNHLQEHEGFLDIDEFDVTVPTTEKKKILLRLGIVTLFRIF
jgi:hypothetical protein